jgi:hypothetical protein
MKKERYNLLGGFKTINQINESFGYQLMTEDTNSIEGNKTKKQMVP